MDEAFELAVHAHNNPAYGSLAQEAGAAAAAEQVASEVDLGQHPSGIIPHISNTVGTCNLRVHVDLNYVSKRVRNCEYNARRCAACVIRIREPKATAMVFASGKMLVTGAKSEEECRLAARKFALIIKKTLSKPEDNFETAVKFEDFKIVNIVASTGVNFPLKLQEFAIRHNRFSTFEPELFPGLVYKMMRPKVTLLVFTSGKIVMTGAKTRDDVYEAFELMYPALKEYRKLDAAPVGA
ncbi:TBP-domain-containing protein [Polyplosphaeria fusca]|uniref:TBP-domain-containing protein n=1 Tax=Polyplosphaeria fusca TaxID=682080 RepID=A0A9P4QWE8_9PLEO|nr:TBP-domain-containing protein [Polyplosphaeria fusca]